MAENNILEVKHLKKYFKTAYGTLHAVDDVNFSVQRGETMGLVGESGCGKSTIGRLILGLHQATSGEILFEGRDICKMDKQSLHDLRKDMQIIFQDPYSSLNPRMSISEIISEPLIIHKKVSSHAELEKRVSELMDTVGLASRLENSYPHELDGGRRQRVGIARALSLRPKFIVCDEPVSSLDVSVQAKIINLLMYLQKQFGLTYLFISHDLSVVRHISNRIAVMYLGQIVEIADTDKIFENCQHPYSIALLSAIPKVDVEHKTERIILEGDVPSPINPKPGCRFAKRCWMARERCFADEPALAEVEPGHCVACHYAAESRELAKEAKTMKLSDY